jgi:hypothetical protein
MSTQDAYEHEHFVAALQVVAKFDRGQENEINELSKFFSGSC